MIYNTIVYLALGGVYVAALFSRKIKALRKGRKGLLERLAEALQKDRRPLIWIHCASMGEFEQGRPIIERLRETAPTHRLLLTFFSPSGYVACQNYDRVDIVSYLPWDTFADTERFVALANPVVALFIKYEFWPNLTGALHRRGVPLLLVSAIFRAEQPFFKWYGGFFRNILSRYDHFFVQDENSVRLLHSLGIRRVTRAGDSRVDRVHQIARQATDVPIVERFKGNAELFIAGSCWPEDMPLLWAFIDAHRGSALKFVIAPHEISASFLAKIEKGLAAKHIRYSKAADDIAAYSVLIVDNVGLLSRIYRYGQCAYVGGGLGPGIHNILEVACYGKPVFFGNKNYKKFSEAIALLQRGGAFAVGDADQLIDSYRHLFSAAGRYEKACRAAREYVAENIGATQKVVDYCLRLIR